MKEIASLLERVDRYLRSARLLIDDGDHESAISRTYYAMFYSVQALLLTKQLSASTHAGVLTLFGKHFIKTGDFSREMSKKLTRAFEKRQLGDYNYTQDFSKKEAEEILEDAREFVEKIKMYLKKNSYFP